MTPSTLVIVYFCVGMGLAVQAHQKGRRRIASAVVMVMLWPLWAPFVLMADPDPKKE